MSHMDGKGLLYFRILIYSPVFLKKCFAQVFGTLAFMLDVRNEGGIPPLFITLSHLNWLNVEPSYSRTLGSWEKHRADPCVRQRYLACVVKFKKVRLLLGNISLDGTIIDPFFETRWQIKNREFSIPMCPGSGSGSVGCFPSSLNLLSARVFYGRPNTRFGGCFGN